MGHQGFINVVFNVSGGCFHHAGVFTHTRDVYNANDGLSDWCCCVCLRPPEPSPSGSAPLLSVRGGGEDIISIQG